LVKLKGEFKVTNPKERLRNMARQHPAPAEASPMAHQVRQAPPAVMEIIKTEPELQGLIERINDLEERVAVLENPDRKRPDTE
jgi:hypothetical protein